MSGFGIDGTTSACPPEQLGKAADISERSVWDYENGKGTVSAEKVARIAEVLQCRVGWLFGEEEIPSSISSEPLALRAAPPVKTRRVPVVSWARAGEGGNFHDLAEQIEEYLDSETHDPNAYALIIEGDSMMPKFEPGDRIVFEPNRAAQNGDVVVARLFENGHVYFKLLHFIGPKGETARLTSFNDKYPDLEFPRSAFRFIHPMHSLVRRWRK